MLLSECSSSVDRQIINKSCSLPDLWPHVRGSWRPPAPIDPLSQARAMPKGSELSSKTRSMARKELQFFGLKATGHGLYRAMQGHSCHQALLRAEASGELEGLRATIRASRVALGLEDSEIKRLGFVLSEAEWCVRECKKCIAERNMGALPSVMPRLSTVLSRTEFSGLGPRLWEDPYLAFAREQRNVWVKQSPFVEEMIDLSSRGAKDYCTAWAAFAVGEDTHGLQFCFGHALTNELSRLPGAGLELAAALASEDESEPVSLADACAAQSKKMRRVCKMLSSLDDRQIDALVLSPRADGRSALHAAAERFDLSVLCILHNVVAGEVLTLQPELEARLVQKAKADPQLPQIQRAAISLGDRLQVDPEHLCMWRLAAGGLKVRLLVVAAQPSARRAQDILGGRTSGATVESWRRNAEASKEATRWREAGRNAQKMFDLQAERLALETVREAEHEKFKKVDSTFQELKRFADELQPDLAAKTASMEKAQEEAAVAWRAYTQAREECTEAIMEHADDELFIQAAEQKSGEAEAASNAAKQLLKDRTAMVDEANTLLETARGEAAKAEAVAQSAYACYDQASATVQGAEARYEEARLLLLSLGVAVAPRPWKQVSAGPHGEAYWWRKRPTGEAEVRHSNQLDG